MTTPSSPEYYEDEAGEVRWRVQDNNGEITEASTEGFENLRKAFDNYTLTRANVQIDYTKAQEQLHGAEVTVNPDGAQLRIDPSGTGGQLADSSGSAGEAQEADGSGSQERAGRPQAGISSPDVTGP